jgi:hypothetical protein
MFADCDGDPTPPRSTAQAAGVVMAPGEAEASGAPDPGEAVSGAGSQDGWGQARWQSNSANGPDGRRAWKDWVPGHDPVARVRIHRRTVWPLPRDPIGDSMQRPEDAAVVFPRVVSLPKREERSLAEDQGRCLHPGGTY